ncbi:MAG: cytochrome d ubiquinol oxidase subunit II [Anaerolineae bacterium]|nr:cytochrome d ubiquinol oxidase subunit II [Anaerolineae bacterium]
MDLQDLWFILIGVLFTGFFFLEGFDYGVGILLPVLGSSDAERRQIINTIGPHWDANEVWMITAGGALFAAFPDWYATLFSGFYLALVLLLFALILRGVAFEFRSKEDDPRWRTLWDGAIFVGSLLPALLWGVAFGNLIRGVPIGADKNYAGDFFDLLSPYTLLFGLASLIVFALHGAVFLDLKTDGAVRRKAQGAVWALWIPAVLVAGLLLIASHIDVDLFDQPGPGFVAALAVVAVLAVGYFQRAQQPIRAFAATGLTIVLTMLALFWFMYPNVMISSSNVANNLTVDNASSSSYTLKVMTVVVLIFLPFVLVYQAWSYWTFRKRITADSPLEY